MRIRAFVIAAVAAGLATMPSAAADRRDDAQGRQYERNGAHFRVLFEGPADEAVAFRAVEVLEAAYYRIGSALNVYPAEPVEVVLHTLEQFRDITRSPAWAGAVYDGRIRLPIKGVETSSDELTRVLAHEFTHAVVASLAKESAPTWLNEGLAGVMEPRGVEQAEAVLARMPRRMPLASLRQSFLHIPDDLVSLAYAESIRAVQRLIALRGAAAVVSLLRALGDGAPMDAAFQSAVGMRLEDFDAMVTRS